MTRQDPPVQVGGTIGDDVMTVHALVDGKPKCGESGRVDQWQRAVTCPECVAADQGDEQPMQHPQ